MPEKQQLHRPSTWPQFQDAGLQTLFPSDRQSCHVLRPSEVKVRTFVKRTWLCRGPYQSNIAASDHNRDPDERHNAGRSCLWAVTSDLHQSYCQNTCIYYNRDSTTYGVVAAVPKLISTGQRCWILIPNLTLGAACWAASSANKMFAMTHSFGELRKRSAKLLPESSRKIESRRCIIISAGPTRSLSLHG